mmetsp:Transcript_13539/g.26984  ORF Transcript_13539/g.26984 Transcript_13539/m.26984 type:complete len:316 (-) Transcript_13539:71-1018(-)
MFAMRLIFICSLLLPASGLTPTAGPHFAMGRSISRAVVVSPGPVVVAPRKINLGLHMSSTSDSIVDCPDRRSLLSSLAGRAFVPAAAIISSLSHPALAAAADKSKKGTIVVVGGAGYVGAHVDQILASQGYRVVSVSRSSPAAQADKIKSILGAPLPDIEYRSADASTDDLGEVLKGASAVVSCVGVAPGGKNQRAGNGAVNVRLADAAAAAGVPRFVYVSVASELANGPAKFLLGDYLKGKAEAEGAVAKDYGSGASLVVRPAIIAGAPPGEIRPPGPPGMAAVSVDAVARAVVAGALGTKSGTIDGNSAISAI